jgi:phosphoglucomutase
LQDSSLSFGGEESAGASFLRQEGTTWTTDKDGLILGLLAAEITARTGKDPGRHYQEITTALGAPAYRRIDAPADPAQKKRLAGLSPAAVTAAELAGEPVLQKLTRAPGNDAPLGGLKVTTRNAWFAARPSGTENLYKLYAESFNGPDHLRTIIEEAQQLVAAATRDA